MALSRLIATHFRNITTLDIEPHQGFNFIIGHNGSGKTSLLETIYYLGHGRSFKSAVSQRIIQHDHALFTLHAKLYTQHNEWSIGLQKAKSGETTLKINGEEGNKIANLAQLLPIQMISPEGLSLLNGGPSYRRAFIDWGLFHHQPHFYPTWTKFKRLLKQRNAALQQVNHYEPLKIWDRELASLTHIITEWRYQYINAISSSIQQSCTLFLPELTIEMNFQPGWDQSEDYLTQLENHFIRDKQLGYTYAGAQKADFKFKVNGFPADDVLSRGQLKLMMCALRLAQGEYLMQSKQQACIFLLDDFASELDPIKRELLSERLKQTHSQVFITAITPEQLVQMPTQQGAIFNANDGIIIRTS